MKIVIVSIIILLFPVITLAYPDVSCDGEIVLLGQLIKIKDLDGGGVPIVYIDNFGVYANYDFLNLPVWVQESLVAHEIGHLQLGHIDEPPLIPRNWYFDLWKTVSPRERDADLFASNIIGVNTMANAMDYIYNLCSSLEQSEYCAIEAFLRRNMLLERQCI